MKNIVIIDYHLGNLRSVQKAIEKIGFSAKISNNQEEIKNADLIILPGVGAFKDGITNLKKLDLIEVLQQEVIEKQKPFIGICLGMQLICKESHENGLNIGLGWIDASVKPFNLTVKKQKSTHVGWNEVNYRKSVASFFDGIGQKSDFYFVHSFMVSMECPPDVVGGTSQYGDEFISILHKDNIIAFQFHPEKSQSNGLALIENVIKGYLK